MSWRPRLVYTHDVMAPQVAYIPHGIRLHDLSGESYYEPIEAYGQSKLAML